jgi:squalene synthase HpnC
MAWSWNFAEELRVWGPDAPPVALTLSEAQRYCRRLATGHYENFPVVSWVLPQDLHPHFNSVYAFCRWADDLGDEVGDPQRSLALLQWWRRKLADCFNGHARHPVFVALGPTIQAYNLPIQPFEDLISAFEQDQTVTEYETFSQLLDYCQRSANPVGRLVLMLFRKRGEEQFAWSDSICTGLQLANFWQDVARDLDIGRIYLPAEDRDRFGVTREDLLARRTTSGFLDLMRFQVERTRPFLKPWRSRSTPPMGEFPVRLQVKVELFARGGLAILDGIEAVDFRVLETRPVVSKRDFAWLIAGCVARGLRRSLWARNS